MADFTITFTSVLLCIFLVVTQGFVFTLEDESDYEHSKDDKHDFFDWEFFKAVAKQNKGKNLVVAPFSVKILLSILSEAADPKAKAQLVTKVLPTISSGLPTREYYQKVLKSLAKTHKAYELNVGSKIYLNYSLTPSEKFTQIAEEIYETPTELINFENKNNAAKIISDWCAKQTKQHIKNLINSSDLEDVAAILVNAIFFKGTWHKIFPELLTSKARFQINSIETVEIDTMYNEEEYYYLETNQLDAGAQILRLPYKGGRYAMTIILPKDPEGLDKLIAFIRPGQIRYLQKFLEKQRVMVALPKFRFDSTSHLKEIIQSLGITEIFSGTSPLPGLSKGKRLFVSNIIQKAGVNVDEKGTEAHATTVLEISDKSFGTPIFRARHPFLFFIEDEISRALLFAGKVVDPTDH